jgi:hypothetical protein
MIFQQKPTGTQKTQQIRQAIVPNSEILVKADQKRAEIMDPKSDGHVLKKGGGETKDGAKLARAE